MTPLINVTSIRAGVEAHTAKIAIETGYTRLLVHEERIDNTVGLIHVHDLLFHAEDDTIVSDSFMNLISFLNRNLWMTYSMK